MATCDACGIEADALFLREVSGRSQAYCEHCAPSKGMIPTPATRHASIVRTQVWAYTHGQGLAQLTLPEPQRTVTVDGELLSHWFICPSGERSSIALLYATDRPDQQLMRAVVAQADERFKGELWLQ